MEVSEEESRLGGWSVVGPEAVAEPELEAGVAPELGLEAEPVPVLAQLEETEPRLLWLSDS